VACRDVALQRLYTQNNNLQNCVDTYAAKEVFGRKTLIIADRFHIAKLYREGLDSLRKTEMKRLKKELSAQDYKQLEGVMWLLRKPFGELSDDERRVLNRLFVLSPKIREAYELCSLSSPVRLCIS